MIDAYEIGIQLLLQDDVSAGLEVINRELAEVDRAIAATSAHLAAMVQEAEKATRAEAVASNGRMPQEARSRHAPNMQADQLTISATARTKPADTQVTPLSAQATRPEFRVEEQAAPVTRSALNAVNAAQDVQFEPVNGRLEQRVAASAPAHTLAETSAVNDQREKPATPDIGSISASLPGRETLSIPITAQVAHTQADNAPPRDFRANQVQAPEHVAVTAAVGHSDQAVQPAPQRGFSRQGRTIQTPLRERAAAPQSGFKNTEARSEKTRVQERATAPQPQGQEKTEGGGGPVILDGRLVGQWLSEHMGREASRPPSGTSFFDPRQTPAWNVSGAL